MAEKQKLKDMKLRNDQVTRLVAMGCSVKLHKDVTPPRFIKEESNTPNPTYDVLLPDNAVVQVAVNRGEAILRRLHEKKSTQMYREGFARKLTWVRDASGIGKVTGFTLQLD